MNHLVRRVYKELNEEGLVNFMDPSNKGSIETVSLSRLLKDQLSDLDLDQQGLVIVNVEQGDRGRKIPLVKLVEKREAISKYTDEVSEIKNRELAGQDLSFARKMARKKVSKSDVKCVKVSWSISEADLLGAKKREILGAMDKSLNVVICVDSKDALERTSIDNLMKAEGGRKEAGLKDLELVKRQKTLELVKAVLEESNPGHVVTEEGAIVGRMVLKVAVKKAPVKTAGKQKVVIDQGNIMDIDLSQIEDKRLLKEIRKKQRQEKERLREQHKRQLAEQKMSV